jgi:hypothetical protein
MAAIRKFFNDNSGFKKMFENEVKSEANWDYFLGFFLILVGIMLTAFIEFNLIKYSGTKIFHYAGFSFVIVMGLTVFYWIKIRYKISSFNKDRTDDQIEKGIENMKKKYKMNVLKNQGTFYLFFFKPSLLTPWTEVNLFYDNDKIYINARLISKGIIDFGFAKRLEEKLVTLIKLSDKTNDV